MLNRIKGWLKAKVKKLVNWFKSWKAKAITKQTILTVYAKFISGLNLGKQTSAILLKQAITTTNIILYE